VAPPFDHAAQETEMTNNSFPRIKTDLPKIIPWSHGSEVRTVGRKHGRLANRTTSGSRRRSSPFNSSRRVRLLAGEPFRPLNGVHAVGFLAALI
jgi:hypothetical protein